MTKAIIPVANGFGDRLKDFITHFQVKMSNSKVSYEMGTKYVKIISGPYGKQILHCFLDFSGNIYKPANERNPKQHSIGSIYADDFGINDVDTSGIQYIR